MTLPLANILAPLIFVFKHILEFFHDTVGTSWGLAIILMTIVIRAALIPLTLKQFRSMAALQRLQPQIKELQAKYKGDKARLNQEMMKFYQENKVNPLASCLPLAAQMPVFISLFYMLRKDLRHQICPDVVSGPCGSAANHAAKFFFIPDLTDKATGAVLVVLLILYVGTQLISGLTMSVSVDKSQRNMAMILPLIFVPFVITFPAGLVVYWVTTNFWTILQQYIVKRRIGPVHAVPATAAAGASGTPATVAAAVPDDGGGGGFMAKVRSAIDPNKPAPAGAGDATPNGNAAGATPPPPPRRKKKRSGRRR
jgi:YidC/Oxa1 family membrane protein insertase